MPCGCKRERLREKERVVTYIDRCRHSQKLQYQLLQRKYNQLYKAAIHTSVVSVCVDCVCMRVRARESKMFPWNKFLI